MDLLENRFVYFLLERIEERVNGLSEDRELTMYVQELRLALDTILGTTEDQHRIRGVKKPKRNASTKRNEQPRFDSEIEVNL
ncbi:hypothetical protein ACOJUR_11960 [Alicyclobacillus tolerans]|uniref:hypothetical protein n=1 Tax=Alicyclobacillus tolerans TaxID=90970 RepID=UPI003B7DDA7E